MFKCVSNPTANKNPRSVQEPFYQLDPYNQITVFNIKCPLKNDSFLNVLDQRLVRSAQHQAISPHHGTCCRSSQADPREKGAPNFEAKKKWTGAHSPIISSKKRESFSYVKQMCISISSELQQMCCRWTCEEMGHD